MRRSADWVKIGEQEMVGLPFATPRVGIRAYAAAESIEPVNADFNFLRVE